MSKFQLDHKFEDRLSEAGRIMERYPDRIPVIVERANTSLLPLIDKNKFLVPNDLTGYHFNYIISKRLKMPATNTVFLFVNNRYILKGD